MLKLGIIGTSAISHSFLAAAKETDQYELRAVYSRTLEKARSFTQPYGQVALYDDLIAFLDSDLMSSTLLVPIHSTILRQS